MLKINFHGLPIHKPDYLGLLHFCLHSDLELNKFGDAGLG